MSIAHTTLVVRHLKAQLRTPSALAGWFFLSEWAEEDASHSWDLLLQFFQCLNQDHLKRFGGRIAWITLSLDYCTNPLQEEGVSKGSRSLSFFFLTSGACSCFGYRIYYMVSCLFESIWCQYDKSAAFDNKCSQSQKMPFFGPKYWLTWLCFQLWVPKI